MAIEHEQTQAPAGGKPATTGHVWDGDLQEYNNPLPVWWTYAFYVTIAFAVVYWIIYPSWPIGRSFLPGVDTITFKDSAGKEESWHWNTRAKLLKETQDAVQLQKPYFEKIAKLPYQQIVKDPELTSFIQSAGKALFLDNCAGCHQAGGQGKIGHFPNLADNSWIYGGTFDKINETITKGRHGYMPPFAEALSRDQIGEVANYVLSLSDEPSDAAKAAKGKEIFQTTTGACYYCHGMNGKGRQDLGSADLTDKIWVWANVPGARDQAGKVAAVENVIRTGLDRGVMPTWGGRLAPEQIKVLTVYVHELGGGQ
jgi:cytochrome c oxidase cbb3-type subunit III